MATITGTLGNNKLAHRDGFRPSPMCPCGKTDGITHMLLECALTAPQRTARHNAAGRQMLRAVNQGSLVAGLIMADVGQGSLPEDDPIRGIPARVPPKLLPGQGNTDTQHVSRPDMLIKQTIQQGRRKLHHYHLVELKYTMNYNLNAVHGKAESQHKTLIEHLESKPNTTVSLHVIPLGVAGGIPRSIVHTLTRIGVHAQALPKMRRELHKLALQHTHKVVRARRAALGPKKGRPPSKQQRRQPSTRKHRKGQPKGVT